MIQFKCSTCNEDLEAPDSLAGGLLECPKCNLKERVPQLSPEEEPAQEAAQPAQAPKKKKALIGEQLSDYAQEIADSSGIMAEKLFEEALSIDDDEVPESQHSIQQQQSALKEGRTNHRKLKIKSVGEVMLNTSNKSIKCPVQQGKRCDYRCAWFSLDVKDNIARCQGTIVGEVINNEYNPESSITSMDSNLSKARPAF